MDVREPDAELLQPGPRDGAAVAARNLPSLEHVGPGLESAGPLAGHGEIEERRLFLQLAGKQVEDQGVLGLVVAVFPEMRFGIPFLVVAVQAAVPADAAADAALGAGRGPRSRP